MKVSEKAAGDPKAKFFHVPSYGRVTPPTDHLDQAGSVVGKNFE
jgi:hypothetical protein